MAGRDRLNTPLEGYMWGPTPRTIENHYVQSQALEPVPSTEVANGASWTNPCPQDGFQQLYNSCENEWTDSMRHASNERMSRMSDQGSGWFEVDQASDPHTMQWEGPSSREPTSHANDPFAEGINAQDERMATINSPQPPIGSTSHCTTRSSAVLVQSFSHNDNNVPRGAYSSKSDSECMQSTQLASHAHHMMSNMISSPTPSPWSGFNLRDNASNVVPERAADQSVVQDDLWGNGSNEFPHFGESNIAESVSAFVQDVDNTADANNMDQSMMTIRPGYTHHSTQQPSSPMYADDQGQNEQPHSTNIQFIVRGITPFRSEDGECSMSMNEQSRCINTVQYLSASTSMSSYSELSPSVSGPSSSLPDVLHCPEYGCTATYHGKHRRGTLNRHRRSKHGADGAKQYCCEEPSCPRIFQRQDARLKHHRRRHPHLGAQAAIPRGTRLSEGACTTQSSLAPVEQHEEQLQVQEQEQHEEQDQVLRSVSGWTSSQHNCIYPN